jgi:hypothetical protein
MTLIVEDGTGLSDAESFISEEDAERYFVDRGITTWSAAELVDRIAALRRASAFLTAAYVWQGIRVRQRLQALAWPRYGMVDRELYPILATEIPVELKQACCEIALAELSDPGCMNPSVVLAQQARAEQVGDIRVEYTNTYSSPNASRPVLTIVNDLLAPFLANQGGNAICGTSARS